jgi:hypothetical protein
MIKMKNLLTSLALIIAVGCSIAGAQPPGYSSSGDAAQKVNAEGAIGIAQVWGEQLKPPANTARAIINLKDALLRWTNINATVENHVMLGTKDIMNFPVLFISTNEQFELSETEKSNLKQYLKNGGFIVVDNALASKDNSPAGAALKQMIRDVIGSSRLEPISNSDPIYHTPFELGGPPAGDVYKWQKERSESAGEPGGPALEKVIPTETKALFGAFIDGRLAVVYSDMGYSVKWNADTGNDPQLKLGVNLIMCAINEKK